jgi:capsular polysaccharide transport system ATP-binding protein
MIEFDNVSKIYRSHGLRKQVLDGLTFTVRRGDALAIIGANGAGKSTLMRLVAGVEHPTCGRIRREMSVSWPIGYSNCFQGSLTGADNTRFIARVYRRSPDELLDFVQEFAQLGAYLHQPVKTYSAGMAARLAFGVSLAIDFDCYLVDEVTSAGDERFRQKCKDALHRRREHGTLILVSHDPATLKAYCSRAAVLDNGALTFFETVEAALEAHHARQRLAA